MREKHFLQDRIELLGPIRPGQVRDVLVRGSIFLNTSLTESFGIAILEAVCAGLYVVSTRVGGVPEILPPDMISLARPDEDDVLRALGDAIAIISRGEHDPWKAHERVRDIYSWSDVALRTEKVYKSVIQLPTRDFWTRMNRTVQLGPFVGLIYATILLVECLFFLSLEWWMPREDIHFVQTDWDQTRFAQIS